MKKRNIIIIIIALYFLVQLIVGGLIIGVYNYIRYNTLDSLAVEYIYNNSHLFADYGEIELVARYILEPSGKTSTTAFRHYSVDTATHDVIVAVYFENDETQWSVISLEIKYAREYSN